MGGGGAEKMADWHVKDKKTGGRGGGGETEEGMKRKRKKPRRQQGVCVIKISLLTNSSLKK